MPERTNVFEPAWEAEVPAPFAFRASRVGHAAGARQLGASLYEIDPGGAVSPLHETMRMPEVAEHLDSGKILTITRPDESAVEAFRRTDAVAPMLDEPGG